MRVLRLGGTTTATTPLSSWATQRRGDLYWIHDPCLGEVQLCGGMKLVIAPLPSGVPNMGRTKSLAKSGLFCAPEVESKQTSFITPTFGQFYSSLPWGTKEGSGYVAALIGVHSRLP